MTQAYARTTVATQRRAASTLPTAPRATPMATFAPSTTLALEKSACPARRKSATTVSLVHWTVANRRPAIASTTAAVYRARPVTRTITCAPKRMFANAVLLVQLLVALRDLWPIAMTQMLVPSTVVVLRPDVATQLSPTKRSAAPICGASIALALPRLTAATAPSTR